MNINKLRKLTIAAAISSAIATTSAFAGDWSNNEAAITTAPAESGFYFQGFGGVLLLDDMSGDGFNAEFDTGYVAGGALGYQVSPAFSIEVEGAYGESDLESLSVFGYDVSDFVYGDLGLTQVTANFIYEFGPQNAVTPYIGVGIGAGFVEASLGALGEYVYDDDTALYYQFIAGVDIDLSSNMTLFAEYRYGVLDEFTLEDSGIATNIDELNAHQIIVGLGISF